MKKRSGDASLANEAGGEDCVTGIKSFKDLIAWQKGMDLVAAVYHASETFPSVERFGLAAQLRRAAVSVPSNVAEGYSRPSRADYVRFLDIARGSLNEIETQLLLAIRLGYVNAVSVESTLALTVELQRILKGLARSLRDSRKAMVDM